MLSPNLAGTLVTNPAPSLSSMEMMSDTANFESATSTDFERSILSLRNPIASRFISTSVVLPSKHLVAARMPLPSHIEWNSFCRRWFLLDLEWLLCFGIAPVGQVSYWVPNTSTSDPSRRNRLLSNPHLSTMERYMFHCRTRVSSSDMVSRRDRRTDSFSPLGPTRAPNMRSFGAVENAAEIL